jgi:phosphoribosyl 1,2-cyclic phosphodiesterase
VRVHLLGVRGSVPTPGECFARYGGNTSCVALGPDTGPPNLVLDAGTGLRSLATTLGGAPFNGTFLLSHLHWDHIEGLPFSTSVDCDDARCDLHLPAQPDGTSATDVLRRMMSPPNFPIGPEGLRGRWTFSSLVPGTHRLEGYDVTATEVAHKGGVTYGYRVSDGTSTLAYIPDHCPTVYGPGPLGLGAIPDALIHLVEGADILIHDALLTAKELPSGADYGHAAWEYAVGLGQQAGVGTVVLFHHSPWRTDNELDEIAARGQGMENAPRVVVAVEGSVLGC